MHDLYHHTPSKLDVDFPIRQLMPNYKQQDLTLFKFTEDNWLCFSSKSSFLCECLSELLCAVVNLIVDWTSTFRTAVFFMFDKSQNLASD